MTIQYDADLMHAPQVAHLLKTLQARQDKERLINTRIRWLQRTVHAHVTQQNDKVGTHMGHSVLPHETTTRIQKRHDHLLKLFSLGNV